MKKLTMHTPDITEGNITKIAELFPNVITEKEGADGVTTRAIDFDLLRQELSSALVEDDSERYRLDWPGKKASLLKANTPITKTLRPDRESSVNFDTTENVFIEGDNFEVLKVLQESYLGKVKMIYIDPPYNTGSDFVYKDNFTESKDEYEEELGVEDEEGGKLFRNTDTNGRFHSDWLSMMYERLIVARDLLKDKGVIFVSIGSHEVSNLRKVCDEVFGESNFVEYFSWVKTNTPPGLSTKSRKTVEYILCYEKNISNTEFRGELLDGGDQPLLNSGNSYRELVFPKEVLKFNKNGKYKAGQYDRVTLKSDIEVVDGYSTSDIVLGGEFKWIQSTVNSEVQSGTTFIIKSEKFAIRFLRNEEGGFKAPTNLIKEKYTSPVINKDSGVGTNETGSSELEVILGGRYFDFPKPVSLIKHIANFCTSEDDVVLDFFAGSATTAHAVMALNAEDGGSRKFVMVQIPEKIEEDSETFKAGYKYISEISKERIRRAGKKILEENKELLARRTTPLDVGFRVYKADTTNMKDVYYHPSAVVQEDLFNLVSNIKEDRTPEDLLTQVILDLGLTLDLPIEKKELRGNAVYFVAGNALVACFDDNIDFGIVDDIAKYEPLKMVFKDTSFKEEQDRTNLETRFKRLSPDTIITVL